VYGHPTNPRTAVSGPTSWRRVRSTSPVKGAAADGSMRCICDCDKSMVSTCSQV